MRRRLTYGFDSRDPPRQRLLRDLCLQSCNKLGTETKMMIPARISNADAVLGTVTHSMRALKTITILSKIHRDFAF
jgi:hypothetical protein